jgi:aspartate-semialdehyde dehydrogenase
LVVKKTVAVIGATGVAGQQFLAALAGHPSFEVVARAASERSAGKSKMGAAKGAILVAEYLVHEGHI